MNASGSETLYLVNFPRSYCYSLRAVDYYFTKIGSASVAVLSSSHPLPTRTPYVPLSASYSSYGKTESLVLDNGHTVSYSICGSTKPSAIPVFFFHGFPSSRLALVGSWATQFNIRLITPGRPGLGLSTLDLKRQVINYPSQIAQLVKHLGLPQYYILGASGGAPYALACAYALPRERLKATGVVAGPNSPTGCLKSVSIARRFLLHSAQYAPRLTEKFVDFFWGRKLRSFDLIKVRPRRLARNKHKPSRRRSYEMNKLISGMKEHFRQGSAGYVSELRVLSSDWGFRLEDIQAKVWLWYGDRDTKVPVWMGEDIATKIEGSKLKIWQGEDHHSLWPKYRNEILRDLLEDES